ncbi:MAG: metal-dependent transcriptional regulator [Anaerolineae bacterium]|nr:metal-dependent transcriptional regulator [Anaerolineae bacterium]
MQTQVQPDSKLQMSEAMCDYLNEIYRLGQGETWVSTTAIAKRLNVSGPATVRMVSRLHDYGLVTHLPYKGVQITLDGQKMALLNIRRHRLAEQFLVDVMNFGWHEVHDLANNLRKGITQDIEDRMDEMLGYPATCPHGEPIPTREGVLPAVNDKPLTVLSLGAQGQISRIKTHEPDKLKYLTEIGLTPGASFQLINRAPFSGPLRLKIGHYEQVVGIELAAALWVLSEDASLKSLATTPPQ